MGKAVKESGYGGQVSPCIVNLKTSTPRCVDVKVLAKASGEAVVETEGLNLCSCNCDLSHCTSVVLILY